MVLGSILSRWCPGDSDDALWQAVACLLWPGLQRSEETLEQSVGETAYGGLAPGTAETQGGKHWGKAPLVLQGLIFPAKKVMLV